MGTPPNAAGGPGSGAPAPGSRLHRAHSAASSAPDEASPAAPGGLGFPPAAPGGPGFTPEARGSAAASPRSAASDAPQRSDASAGSRGFEDLGGRGWQRRLAGGERGSATPVAPSDAGSLDGASLATERGSEVALADIGHGPEPVQDAGAARPGDLAAEAAAGGGGSTKSQQAPEQHSTPGHEGGKGAGTRGPAGGSSAAVSGPETSEEHAQQHQQQRDEEMHAQLPTPEPASPAQAGAGSLPSLEQREGRAGDVGHLPVARTPSGRRISHTSDPGHALAPASSHVMPLVPSRHPSCVPLTHWRGACLPKDLAVLPAVLTMSWCAAVVT